MTNITNITSTVAYWCLAHPKDMQEALSKFLEARRCDTPQEGVSEWLNSILAPNLDLQNPVLATIDWQRSVVPSRTVFHYSIPFRLSLEASHWPGLFSPAHECERVEAAITDPEEPLNFKVAFAIDDSTLYADPMTAKRYMEAEALRIRNRLQRRLSVLAPIAEKYNLRCRQVWAEEVQLQETRRKALEVFSHDTGPETSTPTPDIASRYERDLNI